MKKYFLSTLLIGAIIAPALASAEVTATTTATTTVSTSQNFTVCQQGAIEKRDTSLGTSRTTYNTSMTQALDARKNAEKAAVAITDPTAKITAVRAAADAYKKAVTAAQETLTKSRKDILATFELDTKGCRQTKKDERTTVVSEKKAEIKTLQAERKVEVEVKKSEIQAIRESFRSRIDALRSFFGRKTTATATVNSTTTVSQ